MRLGYDAKRAFHNSSGLGNYSRDIIRIMSEYFPENEFILYNPKSKGNKKWLPENNHVQIRYPDTFFWKRFSGLWRQSAISKQIAKDKIDIYHGLSGEIPRGLDKSVSKVIVTIHDLIFMRYPELYKAIDRKIYLNKFSYAAKNSDVVIAISEQTKRDIVQFLNCDEKKIIVHYQGCHPVFKKQFSISRQEETRKKRNLPEKFILNVGTLEERKNALSILQAVRNSNYHVALVGRPTDYVKKLRQFIEENQMQERVHFLYNIDIEELAILYQLATLFCYPSVFEGFGIPIIEALFSKTAVITSAGGCFSEAGGPDSVYVNPGDIPELSAQIDDLMENEERRKSMEDAGYEFVQKFRDEAIGKNLMKIYQDL